MESFLRDFKRSLINIAKVLRDKKISFTFIGASARNQYGVLRTTEDVDILVSRSDKEKMLDLPIGYIKELSDGRGKRFKLHDPETPVDVIYSGEISGDGVRGLPFPEPGYVTDMHDGLPFMNLKILIEMKLSSGITGKGRHKDISDVAELIVANNLPLDYADEFRDDLKRRYIELWNDVN